MSEKTTTYFTVEQLDKLSKNMDYVFLYSTRSDGKSYAVKSRCLLSAFASIDETGQCREQFAYIRRYDLENKDGKIEKYFLDMPIQEITDGKYTHVFVYSKAIYFGHVDKGKRIKDVCIGYSFSISGAVHNKSEAYPYIQNVIFEEVTVKAGEQYLYNEPSELLHAISTLCRDRDNCRVYLIGNILNRQCPYFEEWQLHPDKLKEGESNIVTFKNPDNDIETKLIIYHVKPAEHKSRLFFGRAADNITKGEYYTELQRHLHHPVERYTKVHTVVLEHDSFKYLMEFIYYTDYDFGADYAWFISPKTTEIQPNTRLITNNLTHGGRLVTDSFKGLSPNECVAFDYLMDNTKVFYSDNLTGTEFSAIMSQYT